MGNSLKPTRLAFNQKILDDDDGVFSLFRLVQDLEDLADGVVRLHDKIAVDAVVGLAFKLVTGDDRFVRRGQRAIEKEGLLGF